jgi:nucleoside-diphosphate-sugar epimerase
VLVLRFAPLVGPRSPLCAQLAGGVPLDARLARALVQPVHEDDAIAGLASALAGQLEWRGWYEVCGADPLTVGELAAAAVAGRFGRAGTPPAWEPAPEVLRAMGLSEWEPWAGACGVTPRGLAAAVAP